MVNLEAASQLFKTETSWARPPANQISEVCADSQHRSMRIDDRCGWSALKRRSHGLSQTNRRTLRHDNKQANHAMNGHISETHGLKQMSTTTKTSPPREIKSYCTARCERHSLRDSATCHGRQRQVCERHKFLPSLVAWHSIHNHPV
jgi:hypothetical protein